MTTEVVIAILGIVAALIGVVAAFHRACSQHEVVIKTTSNGSMHPHERAEAHERSLGDANSDRGKTSRGAKSQERRSRRTELIEKIRRSGQKWDVLHHSSNATKNHTSIRENRRVVGFP